MCHIDEYNDEMFAVNCGGYITFDTQFAIYTDFTRLISTIYYLTILIQGERCQHHLTVDNGEGCQHQGTMDDCNTAQISKTQKRVKRHPESKM